jgi:hypothetical protein
MSVKTCCVGDYRHATSIQADSVLAGAVYRFVDGVTWWSHVLLD